MTQTNIPDKDFEQKKQEYLKQRNAFIEKTAKKVLNELNDEDKEYIRMHPDSTTHHFGLGLSIRNMYIHGKKLGFINLDADNISSNIVMKIASELIPFDYNNKFYCNLFDIPKFNYLRCLYRLIEGKYPDDLLKRYEMMEDVYEGIEKALMELISVLENAERLDNLIAKYSLDASEYEKLKECYKTTFEFRVTQENGTELAFRNAYWDHDAKGIYVDVVTGEPLFSSEDKFESSCGWPAFSAPLEPMVVTTHRDNTHGMQRIEVRSRTGNGHLGHVFVGPHEGPKGVRYCINSAALRFVPEEDMEKEGYGYLLEE